MVWPILTVALVLAGGLCYAIRLLRRELQDLRDERAYLLRRINENRDDLTDLRHYLHGRLGSPETPTHPATRHRRHLRLIKGGGLGIAALSLTCRQHPTMMSTAAGALVSATAVTGVGYSPMVNTLDAPPPAAPTASHAPPPPTPITTTQPSHPPIPTTEPPSTPTDESANPENLASTTTPTKEENHALNFVPAAVESLDILPEQRLDSSPPQPAAPSDHPPDPDLDPSLTDTAEIRRVVHDVGEVARGVAGLLRP